MNYLKHVSSKIHAHSNGLNGNEFRDIIDKRTSTAYLPDTHQSYRHCSGSAPQYRGYPCALWLLFHTLTVSQYKIGLFYPLHNRLIIRSLLSALSDSEPPNLMEVPMAIKNYIKHFFTCRQCSDNFMKETSDLNRLDLNNKQAAIVYLWKGNIHSSLQLKRKSRP